VVVDLGEGELGQVAEKVDLADGGFSLEESGEATAEGVFGQELTRSVR